MEREDAARHHVFEGGGFPGAPATELLDNPVHPYTQALLSAVSSVDAEGKREVIRLEGEAPSALRPPAGCHLHPRCRHAVTRCRDAYPAEHEVATGHPVRFHLFTP